MSAFVILSTHIVSDVEAIATRIAILVHGQYASQTTYRKLSLHWFRERSGKWSCPALSRTPRVAAKHLVSSAAHRSDGVHARVVADAAPENAARPLDPSLEDAYLFALGRQRSRANGGAA